VRETYLKSDNHILSRNQIRKLSIAMSHGWLAVRAHVVALDW